MPAPRPAPPLPYLEINSVPATADAMHVLTRAGYGHFTAMQVRDGRTRGLAAHLHRLDAANRELFGKPLDGDRIRGHIRHALGAIADASVRVVAFEPDSLMVSVRPPAARPSGSWRLRSVPYQRPVAHIKHSSGFAQEYYRRLAHRDGFDEALLTGPDGAVSEGAITNVGCWDGSAVRWPDAPALAGITMQVLEPALAVRGVPSRRGPVHVRDLPTFRGVFVCNSHGVVPVAQVDDVTLPVDAGFATLLADTYDAVAWDTI